jgi:Deoxyribonuclease II.
MKFILLALAIGSYSLSCLDSTGTSKDYWVMLKAPEVAKVPPLPGKSYISIDPDNTGTTFSSTPLNQSSPLTHTLDQLNKDPTINYLFYK